MNTVCPRCRASGDFKQVDIERSQAGQVILLLGGLLLFLAYRSEQRSRVQCDQCKLVFLPKRAVSRFERLLKTVVAAVLLGLVSSLDSPLHALRAPGAHPSARFYTHHCEPLGGRNKERLTSGNPNSNPDPNGAKLMH